MSCGWSKVGHNAAKDSSFFLKLKREVPVWHRDHGACIHSKLLETSWARCFQLFLLLVAPPLKWKKTYNLCIWPFTKSSPLDQSFFTSAQERLLVKLKCWRFKTVLYSVCIVCKVWQCCLVAAEQADLRLWLCGNKKQIQDLFCLFTPQQLWFVLNWVNELSSVSMREECQFVAGVNGPLASCLVLGLVGHTIQ